MVCLLRSYGIPQSILYTTIPRSLQAYSGDRNWGVRTRRFAVSCNRITRLMTSLAGQREANDKGDVEGMVGYTRQFCLSSCRVAMTL
jgi:hypothetical protein